MIFQRITRLWRAFIGSNLTELEAQNAEAMLDLERECAARASKYNEGLAGHAGLIERFKAEQVRLRKEHGELEPKLRARLTANDRTTAGKHALRLEAIAQRQTALDAELVQTEATYKELVRAREVALISARERIEALKRSIDECKVQEALADLTELAAGMHGSIGLSDGTAERIRERMDERKHRAAGRSRVARDSFDVTAVHAQEAEQTAMAEDALMRFEASAS